MKGIRKGKDIQFTWEIKTNGQATALANRDLTLELHCPNSNIENLSFTIAGNKITFYYRGTNHKYLGIYGLSLWENKGKTGQTVVDLTQAFELVPTTEDEY